METKHIHIIVGSEEPVDPIKMGIVMDLIVKNPEVFGVDRKVTKRLQKRSENLIGKGVWEIVNRLSRNFEKYYNKDDLISDIYVEFCSKFLNSWKRKIKFLFHENPTGYIYKFILNLRKNRYHVLKKEQNIINQVEFTSDIDDYLKEKNIPAKKIEEREKLLLLKKSMFRSLIRLIHCYPSDKRNYLKSYIKYLKGIKNKKRLYKKNGISTQRVQISRIKDKHLSILREFFKKYGISNEYWYN